MSRRGFSLVELVIVLSILALLTPVVWAYTAGLEEQRAMAHDALTTAVEVRTIAEQVALDRHLGERIAGEPLGWRGEDCEVRYRVEGDVLFRDAPPACGGRFAVARGVDRIEQVTGGVDLSFVIHLRPDQIVRTTVFLPVPE